MAAKKKALAKKTSSDVRQGDGTNRGLNAPLTKAGKDARARAKKYGTPVGPTSVTSNPQKTTRSGRTLDDRVTSTTNVKVKGGMLSVSEQKTQRFAMRDSKPKTSITGLVNRKSQAGDLGKQRAAQRAKNKKK